MYRKRNYFAFAIAIFIGLSIVFVIISYNNTKSINGKQAKKEKVIQQIDGDSSDSAAADDDTKTNPQQEIQKGIDELKEKISGLDTSGPRNFLESLIADFIKSINDCFGIDSGKTSALSGIKKYVTEDCYNKIKDKIDTHCTYEYAADTASFCNLETETPSGIIRTTETYQKGDFEDSNMKSFEFSFVHNKTTDGYLISEVKFLSTV